MEKYNVSGFYETTPLWAESRGKLNKVWGVGYKVAKLREFGDIFGGVVMVWGRRSS